VFGAGGQATGHCRQQEVASKPQVVPVEEEKRQGNEDKHQAVRMPPLVVDRHDRYTHQQHE
jgi:hypothetical protein